MAPRKSSSLADRSSRLPRDFMDILAEALTERWPEEMKPYKLIIEGRVFPEELFLRMGLLESGQLRQFNFEASMDFDGTKEKAETLLHTMAEALEGALASYFATRNESEYPLTWQDYDQEGQKVWIQSSRVNSALETIADDFLAKHGLNPIGYKDNEIPDDVIEAVRNKLERNPSENTNSH